MSVKIWLIIPKMGIHKDQSLRLSLSKDLRQMNLAQLCRGVSSLLSCFTYATRRLATCFTYVTRRSIGSSSPPWSGSVQLAQRHSGDQLLFYVALDGLDEELAQIGGAGTGPG
jgi:hypothetical protein